MINFDTLGRDIVQRIPQRQDEVVAATTLFQEIYYVGSIARRLRSHSVICKLLDRQREFGTITRRP